MQHLQIFNYNDCPVSFDMESDMKVNATEMARAFNKNPSKWLEQVSTKEFLSALQTIRQTDSLISTYEGRNGGTWFHKDVAIEFARWLSPSFAIWCNDRIMELLTTGKTQIQPLSNIEKIAEGWKALELEVETVKEQNKLLTQTIKQQAPKVQYHDEVLQSESLILTSIIAKELGMSGMRLNRLLHDKKVIFTMGGTHLLYAPYQNKGYTGTKTHTFIDGSGNTRTSIMLCWTQKGREFIHGLLKQQKAA